MAGKSVEVAVQGRTLRLSNLEKVLYPEAGFTKGQVIDYYTRAAPVPSGDLPAGIGVPDGIAAVAGRPV